MKKFLLIFLIFLSGCIFQSLERKGFSQEDLTFPSPYHVSMEEKPVANSFFPFPYSYNISWEIGKLFEGYRGAFKICIENTGRNSIFVYGFSIEIDGYREEKKEAKKILPGKKDFFIFSFKCPELGKHAYRIGMYFMVGKNDIWYDYGLKYFEKNEIEIKACKNFSYQLYKNFYFYFDKINKLINFNPAIYQKAIEITSKYGNGYNIAKVCAIFDYVCNNIKYVNDTDDEWNEPYTALNVGGDCEEFAMLIASLVTSIGGTSRIYITDNHAFPTIYIGNNTSLLKCIDEYYNANLSYALFKDEFGYWLVADALSSFYLGGLPYGGFAAEIKESKIYEWSIATDKLYAIDVLKN